MDEWFQLDDEVGKPWEVKESGKVNLEIQFSGKIDEHDLEKTKKPRVNYPAMVLVITLCLCFIFSFIWGSIMRDWTPLGELKSFLSFVFTYFIKR